MFSNIVALPLGIFEVAGETRRGHVLLVNAPAYALCFQEIHDRLGAAGDVVYGVVVGAESGASNRRDIVGLCYQVSMRV